MATEEVIELSLRVEGGKCASDKHCIAPSCLTRKAGIRAKEGGRQTDCDCDVGWGGEAEE